MPIKEKKKITQSKPTHKSDLLKNKPSKRKQLNPKLPKRKLVLKKLERNKFGKLTAEAT